MIFSKKVKENKYQTQKDIEKDLKNENYHARLPLGISSWDVFYNYLEKTQRREEWKV